MFRSLDLHAGDGRHNSFAFSPSPCPLSLSLSAVPSGAGALIPIVLQSISPLHVPVCVSTSRLPHAYAVL